MVPELQGSQKSSPASRTSLLIAASGVLRGRSAADEPSVARWSSGSLESRARIRREIGRPDDRDDRQGLDRAGMTDRKHANTEQQWVLMTLNYLAAHPEGAFPGEIAKALNTFASNATRDLANLRMAGLVVAVDGRWHCSPELVGSLRQHNPR